MKLDLKMTLLTDAIFGNGQSEPGGEDISVLADKEGFPYFKGGTFKGIFREEAENLMAWQPDLNVAIAKKFGVPGDDDPALEKLRFSDFVIPENVKKCVNIFASENARHNLNARDVTDAFTYLRTFTAIDDKDGMTAEGTLRVARCVKAGITFYGKMECEEADLPWVKEVLGLTKWVGTMRNRGFGKVQIEMAGQGGNP